MFRILLIFIFFSSPSLSLSQSLKRAYKQFENSEMETLREMLLKFDEKNIENSGKYFLYSLYYLQDVRDRDKLDSAYFFIKESKEKFPNFSPKEAEELNEIGITLSTIDSVISVIDSLEFTFVSSANTINEYKKYMRDHPHSKYLDTSKKKWHSLEFAIASKVNTWQGYKDFMDTFRDSDEYSIAKSLYDELLFRDETSDRSLKSFENFLAKNPDTPFRDSLEYLIFKFYGLSNNTEKLIEYIKKYPQSKNNKRALDILYHSNDRDMKIFNSVELGRSYEDSLKSISLIDKKYLLGIHEDNETSFIDNGGDIIIKKVEYAFAEDVFCSFSNLDYFILESGNYKQIVNRNFKKLFGANNINFIEDIGKGLIKISYDDRVKIIHKSGFEILDEEIENAYLVDGRYILLSKNNSYALSSFLGDRIYDFIFYDVSREGPFLIFENTSELFYVSTSEDIEEKALNLNYSVSFDYQDYEYFDNETILVFSENNYEELIDKNMKTIISSGNHRIDSYPFGFTVTSEFGVRVISDKLSIPFSIFYTDIIRSEKYFITERNDKWEIKNVNTGELLLDNIDSVKTITDQVLWYRDDMKEALYFSDSVQVALPEKSSLSVLNSKYGKKTYIKVISVEEEYILDDSGSKLPSTEYFYIVESGNTFSYLSKKFSVSQTELMKMNNKTSKKLYVGEKLKVRGYVPNDVISDSLFLIESNGKKGIADAEGKIILEPQYDGITSLYEEDLIIINEEKIGIFNIPSLSLIPPNFTNLLSPMGKNYLFLEERYGLMDLSGERILDPVWKKIISLSDSVVLAEGEEKNVLINILNKENIIDFDKYSFLSEGLNSIIKVETEEGSGLYSSVSGEILMPVYNSVNHFEIEGHFYFLAKREIPEANLLINLLVDQNGHILLNQALDLGSFIESCEM